MSATDYMLMKVDFLATGEAVLEYVKAVMSMVPHS
jgi:hypothetical protein